MSWEDLLERADYDRKRLKEDPPKILGGFIVKVIKLREDHDSLPVGTEGVVDYVDVDGGVHVDWDNDSLYVLTNEDSFSVRRDR